MTEEKIIQRYELCSKGLNGVMKQLQIVTTSKDAIFISCVRDEVSGNFVVSFFEPMTHDSGWHKQRFFILKSGEIMPYVHFKHVASFGNTPFNDVHGNTTLNELHIFEITHPLKIGDDCQEPCKWDDEKDE